MIIRLFPFKQNYMLSNASVYFSRVRLKRMRYSFLIILFIALSVLVFIAAAKFLYANIAKALVIDEGMLEARLVRIDFDNFHLVTKRLRIEPERESKEDNVAASDSAREEEKNKKDSPTAEDSEEKVDITALRVTVLNEGAAAGSAGKVNDMLISKGYENAQSGNGEIRNRAGTTITWVNNRFKKEAETIQVLLKSMGINAEVRESSSENEEEKSGDVVILLGKEK